MEATPTHRFLHYAMGGADVAQLPPPVHEKSFRYFLDVYVDDFIPLAIATSQQQLAHVASAVMKGIHDVFPAHPNPDDDPISQKKLKKDDGQWAMNKDLWVSTSTAHLETKPCNWKHPNGNFSWQYCISGYERHKGQEPEYRSLNLTPSCSKSDMHSWQFLAGRDSSPHAINYSV